MYGANENLNGEESLVRNTSVPVRSGIVAVREAGSLHRNPGIHNLSEDVGLARNAKAPDRFVRGRMRDHSQLAPIELAPGTNVAITMPDEIDGAITKGLPIETQYLR